MLLLRPQLSCRVLSSANFRKILECHDHPLHSARCAHLGICQNYSLGFLKSVFQVSWGFRGIRMVVRIAFLFVKSLTKGSGCVSYVQLFVFSALSGTINIFGRTIPSFNEA